MMKRCGIAVPLLAVLLCGPASAWAQGEAEPRPERLPRAEVLRLFDAYAVVQAQEALGLDNAKYGAFVSGYKSLLETRRRQREERVRMVGEIARLVRRNKAPDEAQLRERLRALQDHDAKSVTEITQALEVIDQSLTVVERARFRVFEEQMEQRKLDLLSRARAARQMNRRGQQP